MLRVFDSPPQIVAFRVLSEHVLVDIEDFSVGAVSNCMSTKLETVFERQSGSLPERLYRDCV